MKKKTSYCPKCKQEVPPEAQFCPYCGLHLASPVANDYTQSSYTELVLETKRIEVAILKDERTIQELRKKIEDGTFKPNRRKKAGGLSKEEAIETLKRDILGYQWAPGGLVHPMLSDLVRIKEELNRRDRIDDYRHLEKFIKERHVKK